LADGNDKGNGAGDAPEPLLPKPDPPGYYQGESMTRRTVFSLLGQGLGAAAVGAVALPTIGFALAPVFDEQEVLWEPVGPEDDFSAETYTAVVLTIVENIGEAGKTTAYVRRGSEDLEEEPTEYIAISTRCAHLGCPVRFVRNAGNFICPCHGGVYGFRGEVIGGPPVRPLDRFQTRVVDGQVEIGPRYSVTSQLDPVRTRDPGEFTGGVWEYLYPPRPSVPPPPK
jgi:menaquinol-cytochrome c reductase iron-sulfur subunit